MFDDFLCLFPADQTADDADDVTGGAAFLGLLVAFVFEVVDDFVQFAFLFGDVGIVPRIAAFLL